MSHGPGAIEKRIAELFAATRNRALSIGAIADHAFALAGQPATRAQRISTTRAAHRVVKRAKETNDLVLKLYAEARVAEEAAGDDPRERYAAYRASPAYQRAEMLSEIVKQLGGRWGRWLPGERPGTYRAEFEFWRASAAEDGRVYFHPPDVPTRVWAVSIEPAGVIWSDAEIRRITESNVIVRYAGETARLDRGKLWKSWALWRGVIFISSRTGRAARLLDDIWQDRYGRAAGGSAPPGMQMALADAMALLGVPIDYSKEDILAAFRREAKKAHPDAGGTPEMFRRLVEARNRLLAAIGSSAPAPKPPAFAPKGAKLVYRKVSISGARRIGAPKSRIRRSGP